jgi:hypothetical protein
MTISKADRLAKVHDRALLRFNAVQMAHRDERMQCLEDRRFYSISGAQWEGPLGDQFENAPQFEVNKVHLAVIRIINEYRNNRITVDFTPKDGRADDDLADTCDGLYRADEQDSGAQEAYDNAFEEGVGGGFGAWRLRACYEDEEDDENTKQRIRIEPIFDADTTVFFDLDAKRQDKADATRCWVLTAYTHDKYEEEFDDDVTTWPKDLDTGVFDWCTPDVVYVAEYYEVEEVSEVVRVFRGLDDEDMPIPASEFEDDPEKLPTLLATGFREVRQKRTRRKKVHKYLMSGGKVLEDCGYIAGSCIPVVPFYGKRWYIDGIERCMGHVRLAKDAQRLKNMQLSRLGEIAAMSPLSKPIVSPEQIAGFEQMWADDNVKKYPYLVLNSLKDAEGNVVAPGPLGYTKAPEIPQATAALLQITEQDMQEVLGNQQAGEEMQPNISGKAVELIQNRLDMQVFIYMSNFAKAVKRSGEIWLSMAKDLYFEEGRVMKTLGSNNEVSSVELMRPVYDDETSEVVHENDLSRAKFDIYTDVGPSSSSRRAATVRALTGMLSITADPETQKVLQSMAMMNMEGEGISEAREWFRKILLRMGVLKPTEEEAKEMAQEQANQPPDPNAQYLQAAAQEAEAKATKARADTVLTIAKSEETKANTVKTLAEVDSERQQQVLDAVQQLNTELGSSTPASGI